MTDRPSEWTRGFFAGYAAGWFSDEADTPGEYGAGFRAGVRYSQAEEAGRREE